MIAQFAVFLLCLLGFASDACRVERPLLNAIVDEVGNRVRFIGFALSGCGP